MPHSSFPASLADFFRPHPLFATSCCGGSRPSADSPCARRAARLAAFPRLASLSSTEFSEVQFAVLLLRSLPKAILAFKLLAPNTEEWKRGGKREAGLLGTRPLTVRAIEAASITPRFFFRYWHVVALCLPLVCVFGSLVWLLLFSRSHQPVPDESTFAISYPAPLSGSFEVTGAESKLHNSFTRRVLTVMFGFATAGATILLLHGLVDPGRYAFLQLLRWYWLSEPHCRLQRLLAAPVHRVTLYAAEAEMPPGQLEADSNREARTLRAYDELLNGMRRAYALTRRCDAVTWLDWSPFPQIRHIFGTMLNDPALCCASKFILLVIILVKWIVVCLVAVGCGLSASSLPISLSLLAWFDSEASAFTCAPTRPFLVSEHTPFINQSETIRYQLHPCSAETLWADFEFTVNNATTMLQWPCVAPTLPAVCYLMWTVVCMTIPFWLAATVVMIVLALELVVFLAHRVLPPHFLWIIGPLETLLFRFRFFLGVH